MSMYAIKDTTLTALGDAVRSKTIGTTELPIVSVENKFINYNKSFPFQLPSFVKKTKLIGSVDYSGGPLSNNGLQGLGVSAGIYGDYDDTTIRGAENYIVINEGLPFNPNGYEGVASDYNFTFEIVIEGNAGAFVATKLSSSPKEFHLTYTAIGLDENGNEFKYTPLEMVDKINGLNMNPTILLPKIISRVEAPYYSVTKEDLGNITKIGNSAFYYAVGLNSIELPDTVQSIGDNAFQDTSISEITLPAVLNKLGNTALGYCNKLTTVRILNDTSVITCPTSYHINPFISCSSLTSIYIPSKLYNAYCSDAYWSQYTDKFIAVGEWAFDPKVNPTLLFNQNIEVSIQLQDFANTPEFSITSSNEEVATISNVSINDDNTLITYTINSLAVEGSSTITVNIVGEKNTFNFTNNVRVFETIPEPTYEIIPQAEGATYGFALREDGYWESQNFKKGNSVAVCQVNISNLKGVPVYFDCINYAEANYDYGLLGAVNQVLGKTNSDDSGVKKNFKGLSKTDIQTVEYTDATGDCFIQVKFRKDGSGDQDNDSIRFKVRFGE